MQRWFGIPCPGCGLTRSFISLAHGHWSEAWRYNPAGPVWFLLVAMQLPYRFVQWRRLRRGLPEFTLGRTGETLVWLALGLLILQWTVRQLWAGLAL